jgi:DNA-binding MarR family transcriptional regulator
MPSLDSTLQERNLNARRPAPPREERLIPGRNVPGVGLGVLLRTADMIFNRTFRDELARHNLTFSQFQHLWNLFDDEVLSQVELSRRIGIETASSTAVIDQLEKRGLIRRERDPHDRRRINVSLSPAGRALEKPLTDSAAAVNALARKDLSKKEIDLLFSIVERIVRNLRGAKAAGEVATHRNSAAALKAAGRQRRAT